MDNADPVPVLETPRLVLRGHRVDDFADSAAMWADPAVVKHISGTPSSREQSWSRLLRYAGHWAQLGFGYWAVVAKQDHRFVGEVGFAEYQRDVSPSFAGAPEAGWVLRSAEHGQGIATEAVTRIVAWGDEFLDYETTVCLLDPDHKASIHVARKVGYGNERAATYLGQPALIMERRRQR